MAGPGATGVAILRDESPVPWPRFPILPVFVLVVALVGTVGPAAARSPYRRGQTVSIGGVVEDKAGRPIGGVDVVLVAAKRQFAIGSFRRADSAEATVDTVSDAAGRFAVDWTWNPYYNVFRLEAVIRLRGEDGATVDHVVGAAEITESVRRGVPVGLTIVVDRLDVLEDGRAFLASLTSDDFQRIYKDMGKPDRVDRLELAKGEEVAWWYFARGRSYHFLNGGLESKVDFEPVRHFETLHD